MNKIKEKYKKDYEQLILSGERLLYGLYNELNSYYKDSLKTLPLKQREAIKKLTFKPDYNAWYNESIALIRQLIPDRLEDFKRYYRLDKRKEFTRETYTISDYLNGLRKTRYGETILGTTEVVIVFNQQLAILKSLRTRFDSSLFEIRQLLQADLFDSEIETAKELAKKGFYRASGAVCGVVLEKHLLEVCANHSLTIRKKAPHISDLNDALKNASVIDIPMWRKIQLLGDIRNLCDHQKDHDPDKDDIAELIRGTDSIIKNVF